MASIAFKTPDWTGNPFIQQRTGRVFMKIEGTYSGSFDYIEAKLIRSGGAVVIDWFNPAAVAANGKFSFYAGFPAESGYLQWLVRFHNDTGTSATSNAFGTGDIYLVTGQSLAEIFVGSGTSVSRSYALCISVPDTGEAAALGHASFAGWQIPDNGDGMTTLANILTAATGWGTAFIFLGKGGTPFSKDGAAAGAAPYQYLLSMEGNPANAYTEAMMLMGLKHIRDMCVVNKYGVDFAGIIHLHGEADSQLSISRQAYVDSLDRYYRTLRALTGRPPTACPFYVGPVGKYSTVSMQTIREAQIQWANMTRGAVLAADRYDASRTSDVVHWNVSGVIQGAKRLGMDITRYLGYTSVRGSGPRVVSGKRIGATITLQVDLNTHSGIAAANGAAPLTGFVVSASSAMTSPLTISNAVVSGSTIVITLSADPGAGRHYVKFIPTNSLLDGSDLTNDNNVYSTDTATGDSVGLPLQPTACAIIVDG